jgi:cation transport ATPase
MWIPIMENKILFLRISYWAGAILDVIAFLIMLFPPLFAWNNGLTNFKPDMDYRYAMGMGAPLMLGWTVLLLWADRKPMERKSILLVTFLVVLGEVATEIFGVVTGFIAIPAMLLTWVIQLIVSGLFIFSYWNATK